MRPNCLLPRSYIPLPSQRNFFDQTRTSNFCTFQSTASQGPQQGVENFYGEFPSACTTACARSSELRLQEGIQSRLLSRPSPPPPKHCHSHVEYADGYSLKRLLPRSVSPVPTADLEPDAPDRACVSGGTRRERSPAAIFEYGA
ncbi:hypothetical protein VUR80DRAFT_9274 [Thermomyces stellatus]